jgi:hypothetical protein
MLATIRHNLGLCFGVILAICLVFWTYGCESTVKSPVTGKPVTYGELSIEINADVARLAVQLDSLQKQATLSFQELARKDEIKKQLFDFAALTAANNAFNPTGIITLAGSLLGLGAIVDNRIKDVIIKNRPLPTTKTT